MCLSASLVDFLHALASSRQPNSRQLPSVTDNWLMRNKPNKLIKTEVRWILKPRICYVAAKHELDPSYPAKIDAFKKAFNTLNEVWGLSETPKVHIVLQHLGEYLDSAKETLWTCSDENVEACHQFQESKISLMQRTNVS